MSDTKTKSSADRKEHFTTLSGLPIDRLYTQDDLSGTDPEASIAYPGEFPWGYINVTPELPGEYGQWKGAQS